MQAAPGRRRRRACEQRRSSRRIALPVRAQTGRCEAAARCDGELRRVRVVRRELVQVALRLLEVEADRLVVHVAARFEPLGNALVELCAFGLWYRRVRDVTDERVMETEAVGARRHVDQLQTRELAEVATDTRNLERWAEVRYRRLPELAADDRRTFERRARFRIQAVEPTRQQGLQAWRHRSERVCALLADVCEELLDEERVALCERCDAGLDARGNRIVRGGGDERPSLCVRQGPQHERRERRPLLGELGPRKAEHEHGRPRRRGDELLHEVEKRRRTPVQVIENDECRTFAGERLEEPARRPERVGDRDRCAAEQADERLGSGRIRRSQSIEAGVLHGVAER